MQISLIVFVLLCYLQTVAAEESSAPTDFEVYVENEERLFHTVKKFVDNLTMKGSWLQSDVRRFQRLLKKENVNDQKLMVRMFKELSGSSDTTEPEYVVVNGVITEVKDTIVVLGSRFSGIEEDPISFSIGDIRYMRGIRRQANDLYAAEKYDAAYPILLELAKRGFKDSQSRLAYILFNGTERVEKSNLRALGWLSASAHGRTEPAFRVLFKKYMAEVPDHARVTVDQVVKAYQEKYSHSEHLDCSTEHPYAKGVVKRTYCRFKLEAIADAQGGMRSWVDKVNVSD